MGHVASSIIRLAGNRGLYRGYGHCGGIAPGSLSGPRSRTSCWASTRTRSHPSPPRSGFGVTFRGLLEVLYGDMSARRVLASSCQRRVVARVLRNARRLFIRAVGSGRPLDTARPGPSQTDRLNSTSPVIRREAKAFERVRCSSRPANSKVARSDGRISA